MVAARVVFVGEDLADAAELALGSLVVGELAGLGVRPVAQNLAHQGPHGLGVAVVATLPNVNVPPLQFQCRQQSGSSVQVFLV